MHAYLQRKVRELRDQKAFLRNALLCHEPGACQCVSIHRFNIAQAQQMAMGVGRMISQEASSLGGSVSSMNRTESDMASTGSRFSISGPASSANGQSRQQSFSQGYPQPIDLSQPQFGDALLNSPSGQGGFS